MIRPSFSKAKEELGWQGRYGILLLSLVAALHWFVLKPLQDETSLVRDRIDVARSKVSAQGRNFSVGNRKNELGRFFDSLPSEKDVTDTLAVIYVTAERCGTEFEEATYHLEDRDRPRVEYVLNFPVTGDYAHIRLFVLSVLAKHPAIALDQIDFQRDRVSDTRLRANIRMTLFLRPQPVGHL